MPVVMCTERLWRKVSRERLPLLSDLHATDSSRLGNWSAKSVTIAGRPHALFANEETLLCVVVRQAPAKTLFARFPTVVACELQRLGIPVEEIEREVGALARLQFARNANRSLLGYVNELADFAQVMAPHAVVSDRELDYDLLHRELNELPHPRRKPAFADQAVCALLG